MPSGLSNSEKAKVREQAAQGWSAARSCSKAESKAYHTQGTCTFYGTANSNQMLMEAMGLHVPGSAFIQPQDDCATSSREEAVRTALGILKARRYAPIGRDRRRALHRQRDGGAARHRRLAPIT
jgi:phosphogluconate dehydratase